MRVLTTSEVAAVSGGDDWGSSSSGSYGSGYSSSWSSSIGASYTVSYQMNGWGDLTVTGQLNYGGTTFSASMNTMQLLTSSVIALGVTLMAIPLGAVAASALGTAAGFGMSQVWNSTR